jgi:outer membrane lipoprotein-sorting protein
MAHPADGATTSALTVRDQQASVAPALVLPPAPDAPSLGHLFTFMRDAERRFETLRLRLVERLQAAGGETVATSEVWLHHPGRAKVVTYPDPDAAAGSGVVWVSDGVTVRTYDARSRTTTARPLRPRALGIDDAHLPPFGQAYRPLTQLPAETLVDTFVHPNGFCRNVLATADLSLLGTARLNDREVYLLRADHPRSTEVLTDRPDRWLEVAVDRLSGLLLLLVEHVGDQLTRHAEVTSLELDAPISDDVFVLHVSADVRSIY